MFRFFKGVVIAELFALWVEIFYKFGVHYYPKGFFMAVPLYFMFLCLLHCLFSHLRKKPLFRLMGIAIGGVAGLMIEWFLVGNSPWNKPGVFQSGQLLFHGAYPILGYLLGHFPVPEPLRNRLVFYMLVATGMTAFGFLFSNPNLRKLWFLFLPLVAFVGLYYFIYQLGSSRTAHHDTNPADQL
ncbi:MAG: hypothetical protein AB7T38_10220 [Nitrospirales bacterium]